MRYRFAALLALVLPFAALSGTPALAGWKMIPGSRPIAAGGITVMPASDWNQASARPGKQGVAWTHDGFGLNDLELFSAIPAGQPIYRERDRKRNPMPKFDAAMLLPDLADFFERSFRAQHRVTDFTIEQTEPASFGGHPGLRMRYRYSLPDDELARTGEARLAVVRGKLYLANFHAPRRHYFEAGLTEASAIMEHARF